MLFVLVGDAITIAIRIGIIAYPVAIQVAALVGVIRESILIVGHAVAIAVVVQRIGNAISILIRRNTIGVVRVGAQLLFILVGDAVAVAIRVLVVTDTITIQIA